MKVLHVWEVARFGAVLSDYINENDLGESRVIVIRNKPFRFGLSLVKELLTFRPDIVHVHYWTKGVIISKVCSRARIIMHFHGTDIRGKKVPWYVNRWAKVIVSTRDLTEHGEYYGYPIR